MAKVVFLLLFFSPSFYPLLQGAGGDIESLAITVVWINRGVDFGLYVGFFVIANFTCKFSDDVFESFEFCGGCGANGSIGEEGVGEIERVFVDLLEEVFVRGRDFLLNVCVVHINFTLVVRRSNAVV